MVQVSSDYPLNSDGEVDIERWVAGLALKQSEAVVIDAARFLFARRVQQQEQHPWGKAYDSFRIGLAMVDMLNALSVDHNTLVAALVYRCYRDGTADASDIEAHFGEIVLQLVQQVSDITNVSRRDVSLLSNKILGQEQGQQDNIRKMLVAMVDDVRVALIKLADKTCAMRTAKELNAHAVNLAREVFEIYAPLAHRLGIGHIKWELEDLSFRFLNPDAYQYIAQQIAERRVDRERFIESIITSLNQELTQAGIEGTVTGRVKHIYSIWLKMQRKKIDFSQVFDVRAVRVLVPSVRDCYTVLGIVNTLWHSLPNEFDDYISQPKKNGYRSLHTAVVGPDHKVIEIQIRTFDMHQEAEFGVCAHWEYKGADSAKGTDGYEEKLAWFNQVMDDTDQGFNSTLLDDVTQHKIYVFTPDDHVVELDYGSTPLDFAYRVHTEVGHRCVGAKVNGRIVSLTYTLQNGQQVEILTSKESKPSRDWLRPSLGYLTTARSRAKVKAWFKQQNRINNVNTGRSLLEKECKRLSLTVDHASAASMLGFDAVDDLYASLGAGDTRVGQVIQAIQTLAEPPQEQSTWAAKVTPKHKRSTQANQDIQIAGAGNMLTHMASCCKPLPNDAIGGYVTVGRGVTIHRLDCVQFLNLQEEQPERIIAVNWSETIVDRYLIDIVIEAYDRAGLLRDITVLLDEKRVNILEMKTISRLNDHSARMEITMEVSAQQSLGGLLSMLNRLPNVIDVHRSVNHKNSES